MLPKISSSSTVRVILFCLGCIPGSLELRWCLIPERAMRSLVVVEAMVCLQAHLCLMDQIETIQISVRIWRLASQACTESATISGPLSLRISGCAIHADQLL
jgi:hypothetical protein